MRKKNIYKLITFFITLAIIAALFERYHLYAYLNIGGFNKYRNQILDFEQLHLVEFTIVYIISYILLIAACIPGTILFDLLAGFLFGPITGTFLVLFSYLSGAIINFILVKFIFNDFLSHKFGHLKHIVSRGGMKSTAINLVGLRFIPVIPFWLLNILAALLDIPLKIFVITTFLGIIPTSIIYVMIGHGVRSQVELNQPLDMAVLSNPELWLPLIALGAIIVIPNLIRTWKKHKHHKQID